MSKNNPSISKIDNSECKLLIDDKALLDDSDDEEYQPKIKLYSSEVNKNETKCINSNKLIDSNVSDDSHIGISENNTMSDTIDKVKIIFVNNILYFVYFTICKHIIFLGDYLYENKIKIIIK